MLPYPWTQTPPWQQVPWRKRSAAREESGQVNADAEIKWTCRACKTPHRNPNKQTCRERGEARPAAPAKAGVKGQAGKTAGQDKPMPVKVRVTIPETGLKDGSARARPHSRPAGRRRAAT